MDNNKLIFRSINVVQFAEHATANKFSETKHYKIQSRLRSLVNQSEILQYQQYHLF